MFGDSTLDGASTTLAGADGLPLVSVIIPHYDDVDNLKLCLATLAAQTWPRDRLEIVVADNNSRVGLAVVAAMVSDSGLPARVVPAPVQGAGPARNTAIAASRGSILALIDSDCRARPGWIAAGVAALTRFDYAGGEVVTVARDPARPTMAEAYETVFAFNFRKYVEQDRFTGTGNLFVPRTTYDRVGPFRAGVSEDVEWCRRANAAGLVLGYAGDAVVEHPARHAWSELAQKWRRVTRESYLLAREQSGGRLRWVLRALAVALSPAAHLPRVLRSPRLVGWRQKLRGAVALFRLRLGRVAMMLAVLADDFSGRLPAPPASVVAGEARTPTPAHDIP